MESRANGLLLLTVKTPRAKTAQSTTFFLAAMFICKKTGMGMLSMKRSDEILRTALVIR